MKYTLPITLLAGLLAAVFESEGWAMVAVAALLLTPVVQGVVKGMKGEPKEELTEVESDDPEYDPTDLNKGGWGSSRDDEGWKTYM